MPEPTVALAAPPPGDGALTLAIIGDTPYGEAQLAALPGDFAQIDRDPAVSIVVHLGDIKPGNTPCTTEYFRQIRAAFDRLSDPVVYTPGDNEWTDCHGAGAGSWQPAGPVAAGAAPSRLDALRAVFFDAPGRTLGGHPMTVEHQAAPFVGRRYASCIVTTSEPLAADRPLAGRSSVLQGGLGW